jgi:hypothetical protein
LAVDLRSLKKKLEVQAEIDRTSSPSTERPAPVSEPGQRSTRGVVIALVALMLLVTAGIFGVNIWRSRRERAHEVTPATAVPATVAERTLTYWITVQKFKNGKAFQDPFPLAGEINFEPSYRIRVNVRSPDAGHLYILNEGPGSKQLQFVVLFPSTTTNESSSRLAAGELVQIPEKSWFEFDPEQGIEKLWLVFSADAVPELERLKQYSNRQAKGLIPNAAENKSVQDFLASHSSAKPVAEKGEAITTLKTPGNLLVYALRLEHH